MGTKRVEVRMKNTAVTLTPEIISYAKLLEEKFATNLSHVVRLAVKRMYEAEFGAIESRLSPVKYAPEMETRGLNL